jgi:hypothetical protein
MALDAAQMVICSMQAEQQRAVAELLQERDDIMREALEQIGDMDLISGDATGRTFRDLAMEMQRIARVALTKAEGG